MELWIDDIYIANVKSFSATLTLNYEDVERPRELMAGKKLVSVEGSGECTFSKVSSLGISKVHEYIAAGKTPDAKIMAKLDDPDVEGAERVILNNVRFTEIQLSNFEHATAMEESMPFEFSGYEPIDVIE